MLSGDDLIDEFEAMALARACLDYDPNVKKTKYNCLPKEWSEPLVDYEALAKEEINLEDEWDYADLLLEVGIIRPKQTQEFKKKFEEIREKEKIVKEKANEWLKVDAAAAVLDPEIVCFRKTVIPPKRNVKQTQNAGGKPGQVISVSTVGSEKSTENLAAPLKVQAVPPQSLGNFKTSVEAILPGSDNRSEEVEVTKAVQPSSLSSMPKTIKAPTAPVCINAQNNHVYSQFSRPAGLHEPMIRNASQPGSPCINARTPEFHHNPLLSQPIGSAPLTGHRSMMLSHRQMNSTSGSRPILIDNSVDGQSGFLHSMNSGQNLSYRPNTVLPFPFKTNEMNNSRQVHQPRSQSPMISHSPNQNFGKTSNSYHMPQQFQFPHANAPAMPLNRPQPIATKTVPENPPFQVRPDHRNPSISNRQGNSELHTSPNQLRQGDSSMAGNLLNRSMPSPNEKFPEQSANFISGSDKSNKVIFNEDIKGGLESIFDDIPNSSSSNDMFQFKPESVESFPNYSPHLTTSNKIELPNAAELGHRQIIQEPEISDKQKKQQKSLEGPSRRPRENREPDASIKLLKCTQGGSYRFSMGKMLFSRTLCPFCYHKEGDNDIEKVLIRAEYWRRHVTEVHKSHDDILLTKGMTLCLPCYQKSMEFSKNSKQTGGNLPDFTALFAFSEQKSNHIARVHASNPAEAQFVSVWDKKEKDPTIISKPKKEKKSKETGKLEKCDVKKENQSGDDVDMKEDNANMNPPDIKKEIVSQEVGEEHFNFSENFNCPFNDQTFNINMAHEALNLDTDCSFNEFLPSTEFLPRDGNFGQSEIDQLINSPVPLSNQQTIVPKSEKVDLPPAKTQTTQPKQKSKSETIKQDPEIAKEKLKAKKEQLVRIKCDRGEVYLFNPRLFYEKILCPLCPQPEGTNPPFKELTTPHFRKHLEQVHTVEDIEEVIVCKLCHRSSVDDKVDCFDGLTLTRYSESHRTAFHGDDAECDFISIYGKTSGKEKAGQHWGIDPGWKPDPNKVYKYASRKKNINDTNRDTQNENNQPPEKKINLEKSTKPVKDDKNSKSASPSVPMVGLQPLVACSSPSLPPNVTTIESSSSKLPTSLTKKEQTNGSSSLSGNPLEIILCDSDDESGAAYAESPERRKSLNPLDCLIDDEMENLTSTYQSMIFEDHKINECSVMIPYHERLICANSMRPIVLVERLETKRESANIQATARKRKKMREMLKS